MRARNIKPGFFKNEDLAECEPLARLLFVGLWCMSLKEGIIEYRPKKIKAEIFPYENGECEIEKLLDQLSEFNLITYYEHKDTKKRIILINEFLKHQKPHKNEKSCGISGLHDYREISGNYEKLPSPLLNVECVKMKDERLNIENPIFAEPETQNQNSEAPLKDLFDLWNSTCPNLTPIINPSPLLVQNIQGRWNEHQDIEWWKDYFFSKFKESEYLKGKLDFIPDFKWCVDIENFTRITTDFYKSRKKKPGDSEKQEGAVFHHDTCGACGCFHHDCQNKRAMESNKPEECEEYWFDRDAHFKSFGF